MGTEFRMLAIEGSDILAWIAAAASLIGAFIAIRRARPERMRTEAETESMRAETVRQLRKDVDSLIGQLDVSRDAERECAEQLAARAAVEEDLLARVALLELTLPSRIIAKKLKARSEAMLRTLNKCRDGIVLTTREDARIVWCNIAFANALGRTCEEIMELGWRALVNPAYADATEFAETVAHRDSGEIVNQYMHKDGRWITMRWHFTLYEDDGHAFSIVWFERRRDSTPSHN